MTKGIVDILEVVQIDNQKGNLYLMPFGALHFSSQASIKIPAIIEHGELIGHGVLHHFIYYGDFNDDWILEDFIQIDKIIQHGDAKANGSAQGSF